MTGFTRTQRPGWHQPDTPGCRCKLWGPDDFGDYDLVENPHCPVHGEANEQAQYEHEREAA